jgi:hypothetical protein
VRLQSMMMPPLRLRLPLFEEIYVAANQLSVYVQFNSVQLSKSIGEELMTGYVVYSGEHWTIRHDS